MRRAAWLVLRKGVSKRRLPYVGGDGLYLFVVEAEIRHLGGGAEGAGFFQPYRNPVAVEFEANVLEIGADLFHVLQQTLGGSIELNYAQVELAVGDFERDGALVEAIGFRIGLGGVGLLPEIVGLLEVVFLFLFDELDLLGDRKQVFGFLVIAFVTMAAHAAALTEKILALGNSPADIVAHQHHIRGVTGLAAGFHIFPGKQWPKPVFVIAVSFFNAGGGPSIA